MHVCYVFSINTQILKQLRLLYLETKIKIDSPGVATDLQWTVSCRYIAESSLNQAAAAAVAYSQLFDASCIFLHRRRPRESLQYTYRSIDVNGRWRKILMFIKRVKTCGK